ncbi:MAG TPA: hypothetical protein VLX44_03925 [Xanthobacteraceae bacterium]|nr:hypothetical protein [Xanthobacteraceae bacterium]
MIVEIPAGFLIPRFSEETVSLGRAVKSPALGRTLPIPQARGTFTDTPQVDHLPHVNVDGIQMYGWIGTTPLIKVNYADTVTLDHGRVAGTPAATHQFRMLWGV